MPSLTNKTALVVGASRGIGLAIAKELANSGARTILAARSMQVLEREPMALRASGLQAVPLQLDTTNPNATAQIPDVVDILINVAGTNIRKRFQDYTREEYEFILQTNLHGLVELRRKSARR